MKRPAAFFVIAATAMAGCGQAQNDTDPSWSGRWQRVFGTGNQIFSLTQRGEHVTGAFHWRWCTDVSGGTIAGTAHGSSLTASFSHRGRARGTLRVSLSSNREISGSFRATGGTCGGTTTPFHATYVGPSR